MYRIRIGSGIVGPLRRNDCPGKAKYLRSGSSQGSRIRSRISSGKNEEFGSGFGGEDSSLLKPETSSGDVCSTNGQLDDRMAQL